MSYLAFLQKKNRIKQEYLDYINFTARDIKEKR